MSYSAETNDGEVTSWIPLTTTFSARESCSSLFLVEGASLVAFDPVWEASIDSNVICQPSQVKTWWLQSDIFKQNGLQDIHTAYSLLPLICPEGFQTGASSIIDNGATTLAFCCPSEYSVVNRGTGTNFGNCASDVTPGQVVTYVEGSSSTYYTSTTTFDSSSVVGAIAVQGYALAETVSSTSASSASSTFATSAAVTTSTRLTTSPSSHPSTSSNDDDLSTGAKAGIGIGAALGFIGIAALIIALVILWRRHKKPPDASTTAPSESMPPAEQDLGIQEQKKDQLPQPDNPLNELSDEAQMRELDATTALAELEGSDGAGYRRK